MRAAHVAIIVVTLLLGAASIARAGDADAVIRAPKPTASYYMWPDYRAWEIHMRDRYGREVLDLQRRLQDKPDYRWTDDELNDYLQSVCFYVYYSFNVARGVYQVNNISVPLDIEQMVAKKWMPVTPLNPFNGWQPVKLRPLSDGFAAGDVFIQLPPPVLWAQPESGGFIHACGIYGRDEQWQGQEPVVLGSGSADPAYAWIQAPPGAAVVVSTGAQTLSYMEYRMSRGERGGERAQLSPGGYYRPYVDYTLESYLRKYLAAALQEFASCAVAQQKLTGVFPQHPAQILALTDGDGYWWPLNPYSGAKMRIFTPADGTVAEVLNRPDTRGDVYWDYAAPDGVAHVRMYILTPAWSAGEQTRRFAASAEAWPVVPGLTQPGTVFCLELDGDSLARNNLDGRELPMRDGASDPYTATTE